MAHLSLVLQGGEDVGPAEQLQVGVRVVGPDLFDEILEPNHSQWCLTWRAGPAGLIIGAGSGGVKPGASAARRPTDGRSRHGMAAAGPLRDGIGARAGGRGSRVRTA